MLLLVFAWLQYQLSARLIQANRFLYFDSKYLVTFFKIVVRQSNDLHKRLYKEVNVKLMRSTNFIICKQIFENSISPVFGDFLL